MNELMDNLDTYLKTTVVQKVVVVTVVIPESVVMVVAVTGAVVSQ